ncbi:MAG: hypothetical protein CALGDGBN_00253 [Pseudomonadales bacterium]|nr:hypothetical protein [Pseudomonadales bacterium]
MLVAVTGATGFIGRRVCSLLRSSGVRLRVLARDPAVARRTGDPHIAIVGGDLGSAQALRELVAGADAVIHIAGAVRGITRADFDAVNVDGTARLLAALDAAAPAAPLLHFSSLAAREPQLSHYAASKRAAERLLEEHRGKRAVTLLRPPAVYGPGDREMLPVFRFMARTGLAPCAGRATDRLSLLFVDDLAQAACRWCTTPATGLSTWSLHDGRDGGYDWAALCAITADVCGRAVRVWEIPRRPLDLLAHANAALAAWTGHAPMLTPHKLRELRHPDWSCDNRAIGAALGWEPRVQLAEGLEATPGWRAHRTES